MQFKSLKNPCLFWAVAGLCLLTTACIAAEAGPDKAKAGAGQERYSRPTDPSLYSGTDTCKSCHADLFESYEKSPHFATMLDTKKGPAFQGCEACHGPGKAHVEGGGDASKIFRFRGSSSKEISARCLDCHQFGEEHASYANSAHERNNVSCIDCHSPHHAKAAEFLLKEPQPQLCYGCHLEAKQQFSRAFHHKVNEGLVGCNDCHNPHGSVLPKQLRASATQDLVCFKCHTDKAGPFVFEHRVVKVEGCVACHTPHGSSNPRLLNRSQVNLLCLECHAFAAGEGPSAIPSFHNQAQKYQACTMCHTAIHGSNTSNVFFKP